MSTSRSVISLEATSQNQQLCAKASESTSSISKVAFSSLTFPVWYPSFYPESIMQHSALADGQIFICQFCFKYSVFAQEILVHEEFCLQKREVPGRIVYEKKPFTIREVDGYDHKGQLFCQCLCLFAKLFLDNKSICYDVEGFQYYILHQENEHYGSSSPSSNIVGFFSKEKMSWDEYNLACILVFPPYQQQGLGSLLIAFSYELSMLQGKIGSPEKPLSALGSRGYLAYWTRTVARYLRLSAMNDIITVSDISRGTCISCEDVISALKLLVNARVITIHETRIAISNGNLDRWLVKEDKKKNQSIDPLHIVMT